MRTARAKKKTLKQAVDFHGHLGPYLVLGLLSGEFALRKLKARPYFGLKVRVWGAKDKPKSCLIDGLQLSTGCTYGKGNILKYAAKTIRLRFVNTATKNSLTLILRKDTIEKLKTSVDRPASWAIARKLYKAKAADIFKII